jgi:hypothetical protein
MSRTNIAFAVSDISALAKSLRSQWMGRETPPGHVELLNMLARAAGHRNFQQLRAAASGQQVDAFPAGASEAAEQPSIDPRRLEKAARHFGENGVLLRWPNRLGLQRLCLWALWAAFPPRQVLQEGAVNAFLNLRHSFGDPALLRRSLCSQGLLTRTRDGSEYRRIEQEPPLEARALIERLGVRPSRA